MIRLSFIIICVLSMLLSASAAAPGEVRGTIVDNEGGEFVAGAVIQALDKSGKALSFASSDIDGRFAFPIKVGTDSISFRCLGYENLKLPTTSDFSIVRMSPKATRLRDVIVEAPDIFAKGDTLVFNVGRYAKAEDNAIIDVIKRLPGIKVDDDGTIKYQGKPINKFYIDGNDFIGGQYGLATNNISHKDVKSVEVMENHQPIKALEGIEFPEEAGINLKLKEDARSRWVGVAQAATGIQPFLYDGALFTMRIAPKMQNMFTLKADNTGWNPATHITEHDFDNMFSSGYDETLWLDYISADMVNAPLTERRTRDNLSWLANGIAAWKSGDTAMRLKLNYMGDRLDYNSGVVTDYFSEGIPSFRQQNVFRTQKHDLSGQLNAEINTRGYYLKNKFTAGFTWDNSHSAITGSLNLDQRVERMSFSATNDLKLVKRNEKRLFMLTSRNEFCRRPDHLTVLGEENAMQSVGTTDLRSTTETQFGRMSRFWKFYTTIGLDLDYHRLNSELNGFEGFDNTDINNAFLSSLYVTPQLDYERRGWFVSMSAPIKWQHQSVETEQDYVTVTPHIYTKRQLTSKSDITASAAYNLKAPQAYMQIDAPILSDYRNLFVAHTDGRYSQNISASLSYRYRNPLKSIFFNASASYNHRRSTLIPNQLFIGDLIVTTYTERLSHSNSWAVNGGVSKGLGHSRIVIGCDVNATLSSASSMRDDEVIPYKQTTFGAKPYFKGSITRWLSANYQVNYGMSQLEVNSEDNTYHTLSQNISATIIPHDRVTITFGGEHFLTRFPEGNCSSLTLLDASAAWNINNRVRISLTANNLLDKRNYKYVNYGTLSRSEYDFRLRPRNILGTVQYRF